MSARPEAAVAIGVAMVVAALLSVALWAPLAHAQPRSSEGMGALLYESNCQACHTSQVHWRDRKQATDFDSLRAQVLRWQGNIGLQWSAREVDEVARYLNRRYYQFDEPARALKTGGLNPG